MADVGVGHPEEFVDEGGGFEQDSDVVLLEDVVGSVNTLSVLSLLAYACRNDMCVMFPCWRCGFTLRRKYHWF